MKMNVLVVVGVIFVVASFAAEGEFHGATGVAHFVYQTFFVKGIERTVEGNPIETIRQLLFKLGLGNGTGVTQHEVQHGNPTVGLPQLEILEQFLCPGTHLNVWLFLRRYQRRRPC